MKELSYLEKVYNNLNTAFSINFMILQNLARIRTLSGSNVFTGNDVFGFKSSAEQRYDDYFEDYAEIRNDYFEEIREFFDAETYFNSFNTNAQYLIDEYNACFGKNLQVKDVFSARNVKNWEIFNQIFDDVEHFEGKSSLDTLKLHCAFAQFLIFYDSYKKWLSAYEIFEVLERDITSYGGKSLYHGKPDNADVFILNFDDYHEYFETIAKFLAEHNKQKKKSQQSETQEAEEVSLQGIIEFYNNIEDRFGFANSHLMEIGSLWSKLQYHFSHMSDGEFEVKEVYVHKNEILSLISAMLTFPELYELADQISLKFLGKNVDFPSISQKENT